MGSPEHFDRTMDTGDASVHHQRARRLATTSLG